MSIVKKSTRGVSREKWLEMRKQGIGGSEAAALVGLSEYSIAIARDVLLTVTA